MARDDARGRDEGYTMEEVSYKITSMMSSRQARRNVKPVVQAALMNLANNPLSGIKRRFCLDGEKKVTRYVISEDAIIYT